MRMCISFVMERVLSCKTSPKRFKPEDEPSDVSVEMEININQHAHGGGLAIGADGGFEAPDLRG